INIELSTRNKLRLLDALEFFLQGDLPVGKSEDHDDAEHTREEILAERTRDAVQWLQAVRTRWLWLLDNLDAPLGLSLRPLLALGLQDLEAALAERLARQPDATVFDIVQ